MTLFLESQGSPDHCLKGIFAIVIEGVFGYQHGKRLECILINEGGNADDHTRLNNDHWLELEGRNLELS